LAISSVAAKMSACDATADVVRAVGGIFALPNA